MHRLLYYPGFEIQDENFLKFALLYVDEIRPIIPEVARDSLSDSVKNIIHNTDLINPYSPKYEDGYCASITAIKYLEDNKFYDQYSSNPGSKKLQNHNYMLYQDKYTYYFQNYCLKNGLGEECNGGILLNEDVAYVYMSILADIISKQTELDMITDNEKYADRALKSPGFFDSQTRERMNIIQKEIEFCIPNDIRKIPLEQFIDLRSDSEFESARKHFVNEWNIALDGYDGDVEEFDLNNIMECKKEMYGLLKEAFFSVAAIMVGVHSFGNMYASDMKTIDFWGNAGNIGLSIDTLKQHYWEIREYVNKIERKKQARKYWAKIGQLRTKML